MHEQARVVCWRVPESEGSPSLLAAIDFNPSARNLSVDRRYVRLEALEGIAAFHSNDLPAAATALHNALELWQSLQVSDDALTMLMAMGFSARRVMPVS